MRLIYRVAAVALTLFGCVGCDQVSKVAARAYLSSGAPHSFLADSLRLELAENPGSFLSLGASLPEHFRMGIFVGMVAVLLLALVSASLFARRLDAGYVIALALVAGGGVSNLIDRLAFDGRVTDFLNIGVGGLRTGIFNLADVAIMAGALFIVIRQSLPRRTVAI